MALDRVINWKTRRPQRQQLERMLEDFIGGAGTVEWNKDRWYIYLVGSCSTAIRRQSWAHTCARKRFDGEPWKRWIEVWPGERCVDVMTRQHDEYTNAVAAGLARLIARFWKGEMADEDGK